MLLQDRIVVHFVAHPKNQHSYACIVLNICVGHKRQPRRTQRKAAEHNLLVGILPGARYTAHSLFTIAIL